MNTCKRLCLSFFVAMLVFCIAPAICKRNKGKTRIQTQLRQKTNSRASDYNLRQNPASNNYPHVKSPKPKKKKNKAKKRVKTLESGPPSTSPISCPPNGEVARSCSRHAKLSIAAFIAGQMIPKVKMSSRHGGGSKFISCQNCISLNGTDIKCERGSVLQRCRTERYKPYCSVEYGVTSDDIPYVRRGCNDRHCRTCSQDMDSKSAISSTCYVAKCDLCATAGCNYRDVESVFDDAWTGCSVANATNSTIDDTCGGPRSAGVSVTVITIMFSISSMMFSAVL